jgi:acyl-coenzyme A synthetase/AMP-(fatty) acid ligase
VYCDGKSKKWYIVDRKKELIKVRGFQDAPSELETILLGHPHIIDCAVIGVKDHVDPDIEHPRAYVVKRPIPEAKSLDEKMVKKYCSSILARYKELTGGVRFVGSIPRNASGKIMKRVLREAATEETDRRRAQL